MADSDAAAYSHFAHSRIADKFLDANFEYPCSAVPLLPSDSTNYRKCVSNFPQPDWQIDSGFLTGQTQVESHKRILALFLRQT